MKMKSNKNDLLTAYIMLIPIVGLLTVFVIYPFVHAAYRSFYDWSFYLESVFTGFNNYRMVLKDPIFLKSIWVGLKYALMVVPLMLVLSFLFAHVMKPLRGRSAGFVKTSIYIPTIMSGVIASIIFLFIYSYDGGFANYIVGWFGIESQAWLNDVRTALVSIALPGIWLGFGVTSLIMLAGLLDIPESYYEAADIEGASSFTKMISITLPLMKNITLFLLVTGFVGAIQQTELSLVMTNGGPLNETLTPNLYIFNHFRGDVLMGHTLASSMLLFIVLGTISVIIFKLLNSEKAIDG